ncbi:VpsF family polysaccharide biosynthesis protein [Azospirillum sp.]|uniref:VpsF family polysaccharide biosynthesis protein n=1 Tax=Azospirillum sp. TaxID=34012 RepID=UPI002D665047|nr:VpsF family polysaccharide biosynthesis protein [Azospirillum sp.]HYD64828.1 VpsF family polysaccharide biosynthesis protein [Azospirillum sp.]
MTELTNNPLGTPLGTPLGVPPLATSVARQSVLAKIALAAAALAACLGAPLIETLGIAYVSPGGGLLGKIHPSTYLILAAFGWLLFTRGDPVTTMQAIWRRQGAEVVFLGLVAVVALFGIMRYGPSGLAYLVDVFIAPALFAIVLHHLAPETRARLFAVVFWLLTLNALIAIGEAATRQYLIGYLQWDIRWDGGMEFRAASLLGHPLNNALITVPAAILGFHLATTGRGSAVAFGILGLGLLAFGGRAAALLTVVGLFGFIVVDVCARLYRGTLSLQRAVIYLSILLIGPLLLLGVLSTTGLGERIVGRALFDGSAQTRLEAFNIFNYISRDQLWFGISSEAVGILMENLSHIGVIENFWIYLIVNLGIVNVALLTYGFGLFLWRTAHRGGYVGGLTVATFLVVASTNNSLAAKTTALTILVTLVLCFGDYMRAKANSRGTL